MQQQQQRQRELSPSPSSPLPTDKSQALLAQSLEIPAPNEDALRAEKWREEARRLRIMLETEKQRCKKYRGAHATALAERTELQAFLRQCISDVEGEIAEARHRGTAHVTKDHLQSGRCG